ncbi:hypothetical protein V8C34DRAFT_32380 [Trichoderma compactum]
MSGGFQRALPLALTVFCGVVGGFYTFQPLFAPQDQSPTEKVQEMINGGHGRPSLRGSFLWVQASLLTFL